MGAKPKSTKAQTKPAAPSKPSKIEKSKSKHRKSKAKAVVATKPEVVTNDESALSEDKEASETEGGKMQDEDDISESESSVDDDDSEEDGESEDGVDDEGMEKLMKALGDDLDDMGREQLELLNDAEGETSGSEDLEDESGSEEDEDEAEAEESGEEGGEEEEDVALEDVESVDEDAVPRQKIVINNKVALDRIRSTVMLDPSIPWTETLAVSYPEAIAVDVNDDLNRELAFYKQALHGADAARSLAASHGLPFTRPSDYFAEMVKSDAHMERIRQRLLDEGAAIKRGEARRKEREGKKFGKQVQIEKLREREERKKDMENRIKGLKRKHKGALDEKIGGDDAFDVEVENALTDDRSSKRPRRMDSNGKSKLSRKGRDAKFGFGGKGRRDKENTRASTEKFDLGSVGRVPGKVRGGQKGTGKPQKKRPGKSRRVAQRSR